MYCGAGSETALSKQSKQVVIASSMTPMDVNDVSSRPETADNVPESCQEPNRKGGDTAKVIIIPSSQQKLPIVSWATRIAHLSAQEQCVGNGGRIDM